MVRLGSRIAHGHNPTLPHLEDRILKALDFEDPIFGSDLCDRFGVSSAHVLQTLRELEKKNQAKKLGTRGWVKI
jgi:hypothetical protein